MTVPGLDRQHAREMLEGGRRMALATLVDTVGSAPLEPGAMMVIADGGEIEGSVTGGCVEGALAERAGDMLDQAAPPEVLTFGITDDEAAGVGLMCGGTVHVLLEEPRPEDRQVISEVLEEVEHGRAAGLATLLDGEGAGRRIAVIAGRRTGSLGIDLLDRNVESAMRGMVEQGSTGIRRFGADGATMGDDLRVYIQGFAEPPQMIIFGAIDFSAATAKLGREVGFAPTIVDARAPFVSSPRFTSVAEVSVDWPDRYMEGLELGPRDAVLVFTHDPKFDEPALIAALESGAGYVGALGSRRTHRARVERLLEAGVAQSEIDRIAAPCGLDLGARTPGETAISILGEIIARRHEREGARLAETDAPIHAR